MRAGVAPVHEKLQEMETTVVAAVNVCGGGYTVEGANHHMGNVGSDPDRSVACRDQGCGGGSATGNGSEDDMRLLSRGAETDQVRTNMSKMSCCALFVRALWWCFAAEHSLDCEPYAARCSRRDVVSLVKERGGVVWASALARGRRLLLVMHSASRRRMVAKDGDRHLTRPGSWTFDIIEGGQGPDGTRIETPTRAIVMDGMRAVRGLGARCVVRLRRLGFGVFVLCGFEDWSSFVMINPWQRLRTGFRTRLPSQVRHHLPSSQWRSCVPRVRLPGGERTAPTSFELLVGCACGCALMTGMPCTAT